MIIIRVIIMQVDRDQFIYFFKYMSKTSSLVTSFGKRYFRFGSWKLEVGSWKLEVKVSERY